MYTVTKIAYYHGDKPIVEAVCLSNDTLPTTGIANGSLCLVMDTNTVMYFDETEGAWAELGEGGGK